MKKNNSYFFIIKIKMVDYWHKITVDTVTNLINELDIMSNTFYENIDYIYKNTYFFYNYNIRFKHGKEILDIYMNMKTEIAKFKYNLKLQYDLMYNTESSIKNVQLKGYGLDEIKKYIMNISSTIDNYRFIKRSVLDETNTNDEKKQIKGLLSKLKSFENSKNSKFIDKISETLSKYPENYEKKIEKISKEYNMNMEPYKYIILDIKNIQYLENISIDEVNYFKNIINNYIYSW